MAHSSRRARGALLSSRGTGPAPRDRRVGRSDRHARALHLQGHRLGDRLARHRRLEDLPPALKREVKRVVLRECRQHCVYCGGRLTIETTTLDHVLPRARGGTHDLANLVAACVGCNRAKADALLDEFVRTRPGAGACFLRYAQAVYRATKRRVRRAVSLASAAPTAALPLAEGPATAPGGPAGGTDASDAAARTEAARAALLADLARDFELRLTPLAA